MAWWHCWRCAGVIAYPVLLTLALSVGDAILQFFGLGPGLGICSFWAYLSLSTWRRWRWTVGCGLAIVAVSVVGLIQGSVTEGSDWSVWLIVPTGMVLCVALTAAIGSYIGARRETKQATADRIVVLEREREVRAESARGEKRARLAREMHDVLAHKLFLIALHSGALVYRKGLTVAEAREVADTVQTSARQALAELSTILGELRQVSPDGVVAPQPDLGQLDALIAEHRGVGRKIQAEVTVNLGPQSAAMPIGSCRNASPTRPGTRPVRL
ncbi:MAG: histidine kinase dimerization/phosphoacceptor domain-containing protein [Propionibacteriaceae bacterium]|nr:histidine kinase dimerization/phosphoacceptor domain-containing protein [Propionibacteriaceae bacterium]